MAIWRQQWKSLKDNLFYSLLIRVLGGGGAYKFRWDRDAEYFMAYLEPRYYQQDHSIVTYRFMRTVGARFRRDRCKIVKIRSLKTNYCSCDLHSNFPIYHFSYWTGKKIEIIWHGILLMRWFEIVWSKPRNLVKIIFIKMNCDNKNGS